MPRVRRTPPPQHIVVVDTNILWDKDKKLSVCAAFDEFWKRNSPLIPMTLNVPEVVFGELHFQQTTSALKSLSSINDSFSELAGITSAPYTHKCNEAVISRSMFLAALLDWIGTSPPTSEGIASCSAIAQGQVHLRSVYETGGQVLGNRPLESDGIEPAFFLSESPGVQCMLLRGYERLRKATAKEQASLPVFSTWGYLFIAHKAEELGQRAA